MWDIPDGLYVLCIRDGVVVGDQHVSSLSHVVLGVQRCGRGRLYVLLRRVQPSPSHPGVVSGRVQRRDGMSVDLYGM